MNSQITQALEAVAACKELVEDYTKRIEEACVEYYKTGQKLFPSLSRAEDEDADRACKYALEMVAAVIPDAKARFESIKYPINQYDEQIERMRDVWLRRRNLFRSLEITLMTRIKTSSAVTAELSEEKLMPHTVHNRTIIIHGHDETNMLKLQGLLTRKLKLPEPVIMSQEMVPGASLPEKFELLASKVGFAIALLTPDDVGRPKSSAASEERSRPRQNTLVEIGWFWGRLGRERILLLLKKDLELPSDLQGLVYYPFETNVEEISEKIRDFYEVHKQHST